MSIPERDWHSPHHETWDCAVKVNALGVGLNRELKATTNQHLYVQHSFPFHLHLSIVYNTKKGEMVKI